MLVADSYDGESLVTMDVPSEDKEIASIAEKISIPAALITKALGNEQAPGGTAHACVLAVDYVVSR